MLLYGKNLVHIFIFLSFILLSQNFFKFAIIIISSKILLTSSKLFHDNIIVKCFHFTKEIGIIQVHVLLLNVFIHFLFKNLINSIKLKILLEFIFVKIVVLPFKLSLFIFSKILIGKAPVSLHILGSTK